MSKTRTLAALAVGLAVVAVPRDDGWAVRPVSAHPDATSVVSGFVTDHGSPVQDASILVWAWPDQRSRRHLKPGDSLPLYPVGAGLTSSTGAFRVDAAPGSLPRRVKNRRGIVNFELDAVSGDRTLVYRFSARPAGGSRSGSLWRPLPEPTGGRRNAIPTFRGDFGSRLAWISTNSPQTWVDERGKLVSRDDAAQAERASVGPTTAHDSAMAAALRAEPEARDGRSIGSAAYARVVAQRAGGSCQVTLTSNILNKVEHFVNIETMPGIPETVTEEGGASHSLGIGISVAGGAWIAGGTASITRSSDSKATTTDNNAHTETNLVDYQQFTNQCAGRLEKDPWKFADMLTDDGHALIETWYTASCGNHKANDTWDTTSATAATFDGGIDLGPVSVSAQSGYRSSENLHYLFNTKGEVCGNNNQGPLSSSLVEADTGSSG